MLQRCLQSFFFVLSLFFFFVVDFQSARAQAVPSLNGIRFDEETGDVIFVAVGHVYGRLENTTLPYSEYPAVTLLANQKVFADPDIDFVMLLGDIVHKANEKQFRLLASSFLNALSRPVFNAVGNHELQNREVYTERFGKTFFTFQRGDALFVVLDGELDHGLLIGEQKQMFFESIRLAQSDDVRFLVLFSHKVLWNSQYFAGSQTERDAVQKEFSDTLLPALLQLPRSKSVLWFAGDYLFPLVHEAGPRPGMHFFTLGLREDATDLALRVTLPTQGEPAFQPISLSENPTYDISTYTTDFWLDWYRRQYPNPSSPTDPYWFLQQPQNLRSFFRDLFFNLYTFVALIFGIFFGVLLFCFAVFLSHRILRYWWRCKDDSLHKK